MTTGMMHDQNLERHIQKQMGCMAGFFHFFDRHHILSWKRLCATKRLPPAAKVVGSTLESEKYVGSPALSPRPDRLRNSQETELQSSAAEIVTPAEKHVKSPLPLPIFHWKEETKSSLKLRKEAPRFSLDSRATIALVDGDDVRRSPSVVARLMGLEPLPHSSTESVKNAELLRSASESRLSRDLLPYQFIDNNNFHLKQPNQSHLSNVSRNNASVENSIIASFNVRNPNSEPPKPRGVVASPWKSSQQRNSYFDSEDFFREPKQTASIYGEIERRLKMRGIDQKSNNLEALKQILEALQLKGLQHSDKHSDFTSQRNFVHGRSFSSYKSPIVVMKPSRPPVSPRKHRIVTDSPPTGYRTGTGVRRNLNYGCECSSAVSPRRRERPETDRNGMDQVGGKNLSSPTRREIKAKNPISPARGRPLHVDTQKRVSSVNSPKRIGSDQMITNRSPRNRKPTAQNYPKEKNDIFITMDESSSIFGSSVSTFSETDTEKWKTKECKEGSSLLERCDKLLHSTAEMTATELQPSPVSVLDASFYKDESFSPSPIMKRSIDFGEQQEEFEEEIGSPAISPIQSKCEDPSDDCYLIYISEILRYSNYLLHGTDLFLLLEKQQYLKGNDTSYDSRLQRKLVFDTVAEILDREKHLPTWKMISSSLNSLTEKTSLNKIWIQFQRIRERDTAAATAESLVEMICGLLRKDLAAGDAIDGWGDPPVEMSEAVLDIERMIFKDLVGETIRDLEASDWNNNVVSAPCRKLVF